MWIDNFLNANKTENNYYSGYIDIFTNRSFYLFNFFIRFYNIENSEYRCLAEITDYLTEEIKKSTTKFNVKINTVVTLRSNFVL